MLALPQLSWPTIESMQANGDWKLPVVRGMPTRMVLTQRRDPRRVSGDAINAGRL